MLLSLASSGMLLAQSSPDVSEKSAREILSDEWAQWLNHEGELYWGKTAEPCDDLLLARRLYLDLLGRVPSVAEMRDYLDLDASSRRATLVDQLVFGLGARGDDYKRTFSDHWARQWRRIMVPPSVQTLVSTSELENWLAQRFASDQGFDAVMSSLVELRDAAKDNVYFRASQSNPATYAANVSRVMLGVRLECTQCHDHPFTDWKQSDFWGLAAFYSDLGAMAPGENAPSRPGSIKNDGVTYVAKVLWEDKEASSGSRVQLAKWLTSAGNKHFASVATNRFWQQLVGRGVFASVDDLDIASPQQRQLLDALGKKFADAEFPVRSLVAAICKSQWYQAVASSGPEPVSTDASESSEGGGSSSFSVATTATIEFHRPIKSLSPEQVFDSLEQALMLPISRLDPTSARWTGERMQVVARLSESSGKTPEEYASGIPQALVMMNGKLTADAISVDNSRLLRATLDSPFMSASDRIDTLCMATLSRHATKEEMEAFVAYIQSQRSDAEKRRAHGEILWALVNSPEFVLCR
jgi:hypothetical protein